MSLHALLRKLLYFWKLVSLPLLGPRCRFEPTCSEYAVRAIEDHGVFKGLYLGIRRLSCCHSLSKKDYFDPVPERHVRSRQESHSRK